MNEFAQPILDTIAGQKPNFEEDFSGSDSSLSLSRWLLVKEGYDFEPLQISDYISDGMLKLEMQADADYYIQGSMINSSNFVLQFDALPKRGVDDIAIKFRESGENTYSLALVPCCEIWSLNKGGGGETLDRGESETIAHNKSIRVLLIAQGDQFAVYLNELPLAYFQHDEYRHGSSKIFFVTRDVDGLAELDNLKFWRLNGP